MIFTPAWAWQKHHIHVNSNQITLYEIIRLIDIISNNYFSNSLFREFVRISYNKYESKELGAPIAMVRNQFVRRIPKYYMSLRRRELGLKDSCFDNTF